MIEPKKYMAMRPWLTWDDGDPAFLESVNALIRRDLDQSIRSAFPDDLIESVDYEPAQIHDDRLGVYAKVVSQTALVTLKS